MAQMQDLCPWRRCQDARTLRADQGIGGDRRPRIWQTCSCMAWEYPCRIGQEVLSKWGASGPPPFKQPPAMRPMFCTWPGNQTQVLPPPSKPAPAVAAALPYGLPLGGSEETDTASGYWNEERVAALTAADMKKKQMD